MGTKGDLQRQRVIESASYCLAHFGDRGTTFQSIAEHCQISQASVVKYLKTRDNIFPMVLNHWISRAREKTEAAIHESDTPEQKIKSYLKVSKDLFHEKHEISMVILTLHYLAGIDEKYRAINSEIKEVAQKRIAGFIEDGIKDGSFKKVNAKLCAKTIHNALMGYLLSSVSEKQHPSDLQIPALLAEFSLGLLKS